MKKYMYFAIIITPLGCGIGETQKDPNAYGIVTLEPYKNNTITANNSYNFSGETEDMYGCTDTTALNYDSNADFNDGTCEFPVDIATLPSYGCTDQNATNYDSHAEQDDGSCHIDETTTEEYECMMIGGTFSGSQCEIPDEALPPHQADFKRHEILWNENGLDIVRQRFPNLDKGKPLPPRIMPAGYNYAEFESEFKSHSTYPELVLYNAIEGIAEMASYPLYGESLKESAKNSFAPTHSQLMEMINLCDMTLPPTEFISEAGCTVQDWMSDPSNAERYPNAVPSEEGDYCVCRHYAAAFTAVYDNYLDRHNIQDVSVDFSASLAMLHAWTTVTFEDPRNSLLPNPATYHFDVMNDPVTNGGAPDLIPRNDLDRLRWPTIIEYYGDPNYHSTLEPRNEDSGMTSTIGETISTVNDYLRHRLLQEKFSLEDDSRERRFRVGDYDLIQDLN